MMYNLKKCHKKVMNFKAVPRFKWHHVNDMVTVIWDFSHKVN